MSTQVTIEHRVTITTPKPKPKFAGVGASIYWHTLDELAEVGELWDQGESVRLALVTRSFANQVDPATQRCFTDLTEDARDHILTQKTVRLSDRSVGGGFFFGPPHADFPLADPEQEVGGLLAYSAATGRLLFFLRATPGTYTSDKPIRTIFVSGIYAQVKA